MICIEHLSKHVELIPIPDKEPSTTARAFLTHVLGRFGACAQVVTDRGTEWEGEFAQLLARCYIDPRKTSAGHPQSDGLTERCVATIKQALRKMCEERASVRDWDEYLGWIGLGYRCSKQRATGMCPYEVLYARQPVVPPAVFERWEEPLDLSDPVLAAQLVLARAKLAREHEVVAAANLRIAQHRDTLRYAYTRSGKFVPRLVKFQVGDYVYVQRGERTDTLQIAARPDILRIKELRPDGVVVLQGRCGTTKKVQVSQLAPCHLPDIDGTIDPAAQRFDADWRCEVCSLPQPEDSMLLCDWCNSGWHMECLTPPLGEVPPGVWLCPYCVEDGVQPKAVEFRQQAAQALVEAPPDMSTVLHPTSATKQRDRRAAALHGRLVVRPFKAGRGRVTPKWGLVHFTSPEHRPAYFKVVYEDGSVYENVSYTQVKKYLMPEGTVVPPGVTIPALQEVERVGTCMSSVVGLDFQGRGPAVAVPSEGAGRHLRGEFLVPEVCEALSDRLGGAVSLEVAKEACGSLCWMPSDPAQLAWDARQFWPLFEAIDFSLVRSALDPFYGSAQVVQGLVERGKLLVTCQGEIEAEGGGSLKVYQPGFWQEMVAQHRLDAVISRPVPGVLDLVLPLALEYVPLVCALVPALWVEDAHLARKGWMQRLSARQLLHVVATWPDDLQGERCVWLCLFRNQAVRQQVWRRAQGRL